jgi:hypothetical protein
MIPASRKAHFEDAVAPALGILVMWKYNLIPLFVLIGRLSMSLSRRPCPGNIISNYLGKSDLGTELQRTSVVGKPSR